MLRPRTLVSAALLTLGVSLAALVPAPGPASAHITVDPSKATQGGYIRVAFRVPTESDTASTTRVEIFLPADAPIASVSTMPVPGWTATVQRKAPTNPVTAHGEQLTEVVSKITWTATAGAAVKPGEFQEFPVSLGPLPKSDKLIFKALQTYSDGNVVRWIEEPVEGGEEPESPAPVVTLAATAQDGAVADVSAGSAPAAATEESTDSGPALVVAIVGLVAGLVGAVLGALALFRVRRRTQRA